MSKKLFIGGLSWNTNDDGLRQAFESFGELEEVKVIFDRQTNRSRGFGFVTYQNDADAQTAIEEMNGKELDGRAINVDVAQDKPRRNDRGGGGGGGGGGRPRYNRDDRGGNGGNDRW